jgi:hypothetical protein
MEPTLDEALSALFVSPQQTPLAGAPLVNGVFQPSTEIDQERLQLQAAQKAIDSLKLMLNGNPGVTPASKVPHQ